MQLVAATQLRRERHEARIVGQRIGERAIRGLEDRQRGLGLVVGEERPAEGRDRAGERGLVVAGFAHRDRATEGRGADLEVARRRRGRADPLEQVGLLARIRRDGPCPLQVRDRLFVRPERDRPVRGGPQGDPRLGGDRVGLLAFRRCEVRVQVVGREDAGRLVVAELLEVAGRREVPRPAIAPGERPVGDLAQERLGEAVLAALRRPRVGVEDEDLAPDERPQARFDRRRVVAPGSRRARRAGSVWPRTAPSWRRARSAGSSASSRAAMRAWSVSGTARSPRSPVGR